MIRVLKEKLFIARLLILRNMFGIQVQIRQWIGRSLIINEILSKVMYPLRLSSRIYDSFQNNFASKISLGKCNHEPSCYIMKVKSWQTLEVCLVVFPGNPPQSGPVPGQRAPAPVHQNHARKHGNFWPQQTMSMTTVSLFSHVKYCCCLTTKNVLHVLTIVKSMVDPRSYSIDGTTLLFMNHGEIIIIDFFTR